MCGPYGSRGPRYGCDPEELHEQVGPKAQAYLNVLIKDEDTKNHHSKSNDWMASQGIIEKETCYRFCLNLGGVVHI